MGAESEGLQWKMMDLHVHSPGSKDYSDLGTPPSSVIDKALEVGLDAFAITDHNTGAWVDKLKVAAAGRGLVVFPGVEVTVMGGERNVHLLAIFDPSKGTSHVHDFLAQIGITEDKRGSTDTLANGDVNQVIDKIAHNDGVALLAHSDSTSGVLKEIRGQARISIVRNPRLLGVEIAEDETAQFLKGDDPDYRRRLACFKGSDSHSLEELGRRVCYFKLGAMSIAGLRQCLYDPDTRIRTARHPEVEYPTILNMKIAGGFFDGVCATFHPGLNSVLGGKGVGKSLLVEFLRFALDQPSDVPAIRKDMESKLEKQLGLGGSVTVACEMASGTVYSLARQFDGVTNPAKVVGLTDETEYVGSVSKLFPVLVYSQNEVIDISRDTNVQRLLIDRLIDVDAHYAAMESNNEKLRANTRQNVEATFAAEKTAALNAEIATTESQIQELDTLLGDPKFAEKKDWDRRADLLINIEAHARLLVDDLKGVATEDRLTRIPEPREEDRGDRDITQYHRTVSGAGQQLLKAVRQAIEACEEALRSAGAIRDRWEKRKARWEKEFDQFLETTGGEQKALSKRRTKLQGQLTDLKSERDGLVATANQLKKCSEEREGLLDGLDGARRNLYDTRSKVYAELTRKSEGRLRLELLAGEDRGAFINGIAELCHGMRIQQRFIETLGTKLTPREFASVVMQRHTDKLEELGLTSETSSKIVNSISGNEILLEKLLALPYECTPEDVPRILYQKDDGEYYPLSELSVGQKCTALILIALSEGTMPIIIDQPEDALDVATVYLDVVQSLRRGKDQRQFIVTTHNANVAVSSDSDKFHVLKGTAREGEIVCAGAIDLDVVAKEVIEHLEGGVEPYLLRGLKYNVRQDSGPP